MPKIKDPNVPSHDASLLHHGAISVEMLPNGSAPGDMLYWDGVQWNLIRLTVGGGLDLSYNALEKTIELYYGAGRVYGSFTADAVTLATIAYGFSADAVLE